MSRTYFVGDGALNDEDKKILEISQAAEEARNKSISDQNLEQQRNKKRTTLEEMLACKMELLEDRVLIWPDPAPDEIGGLIVPDEAKAKLQHEQARGTVVVVGPGKRGALDTNNVLLLNMLEYASDIPENELFKLKDEVGKSIEIKVKPGDRVIYGRYAGTPVKDATTGEEVLIMRQGDIFCIL